MRKKKKTLKRKNQLSDESPKPASPETEDDFVERLKRVRETLNFKQNEFSSQLNISEASYSEFENGKHKPKYDFIYNLAVKFNVNLHYLMVGEGDMFRDPAGSAFKNMDNILVDRSEVSRFLWYFERSPLVQFNTISNFRNTMRNEKESIEQEIAEFQFKKENPGLASQEDSFLKEIEEHESMRKKNSIKTSKKQNRKEEKEKKGE